MKKGNGDAKTTYGHHVAREIDLDVCYCQRMNRGQVNERSRQKF